MVMIMTIAGGGDIFPFRLPPRAAVASTLIVLRYRPVPYGRWLLLVAATSDDAPLMFTSNDGLAKFRCYAAAQYC